MEEVKTESTVAEKTTVDNSVEGVVDTLTEPKVLDLLSDELKTHKALQNYDTVDSMAKSLLSAQELVGKRVQDLNAEELLSLDSKFGKPENADGYSIDGNPEFKAKAFDIGLNNKQALKLFELETAVKEEQSKAADLASTTRMNEVGKELEEAFGAQLEARVELAKKAAMELGGSDLYNTVFDEKALGDPKLIKALSEAGKRIFDHESVATNQITKFGLTPTEARNELNLLKRDGDFMSAYMNSTHAGHAGALEEFRKLHKIAAE